MTNFTERMTKLRNEVGFTHSHIAPIDFLEFVPTERQTMHLILAHLLENKEYCDFYRERHEAGDVILLDNGAFEFHEPIPVEKYHSMMVQNLGFDVDMVVAPDYPFKPSQVTIDATMQFLDEFEEYFDHEKTKVMAVPQSEKGDYKDWVRCYKELTADNRISAIGLSILGTPNAFCELTGTEDISVNRRAAVEYLQSHGINDENKWHHFLGCGDPREIVDMILMQVADSNDSSTAIWHAINDISFDNTGRALKDGKTRIPVDFHLKMSSFECDDRYSISTRASQNVKYIEDMVSRVNDAIL